MAAIATSAGFQERIRRIEAAQRAKAQAVPAESELLQVFGHACLRLAVVMPVWLVLLKAALIWQMGIAGYTARLATIDADGIAGQAARLVMQPDAVTQVLTRMIAAIGGM